MSLMNHKIVVKILGKLIQLEGIFLLLPAIAGVLFQEKETLVLAITAVASIFIGGLLQLVKVNNNRIRAK